MAKFVILGAGMTGLRTAYHLKSNYFLAEENNKVGGLSGSIEKNGFIFDYAEHFLRIPNKKIEQLLRKLMGDNICSQRLISAIFFKEKFIPYPFQENLRDLPSKELKKCAISLIKNYFFRNQNLKEFSNFEEFIYYQYGEYIADKFMIPYNKKIWQIEPNQMNTSWFINPNLISSFNLEQIISSILPITEDSQLKNVIRWYPVKGGSQELSNSFLPYLNHLALNHQAINIDIDNKIVEFQNGYSEPYEYLISTIPLPKLLDIINIIPTDIKNLKEKLKYNSVFCLNLCLNKETNHNYHWLYFPQDDIPFTRLFFSNNFSKNNAPLGKGSCSALATHLPDSKFNEDQFKSKSVQKLIELGFLNDVDDIIDYIPITIEYGFTLPTIKLNEVISIVKEFLKNYNIYSIGRYGEWKYAGMEHAIEDGEEIANILL